MSLLKHYSIADTFGIHAPANMKVEGFEPSQNLYVPKQKPYVFRKDHLRDVLAFLGLPNGDGLYLTGPTGSGKTSLLEQVAARLQWGVHAVTGHGRMELNDLLGQYMLVDGGAMQWIDGPLTLAVRLGHVLLINEIDAVDPAELIGLNEIVEGKALTIPQTGAVLIPHPKFRLVVTGNSAGSGDQSGLYQGVLRQNISFLDRFRLMEVGYPDPEDEMKLLAELVPNMPETLRESMIKVANQIRKVFMGGQDGGGMLSVTLSTRGLMRWALLVATFKSAPNALAYSLDRALTFRAEASEREAIHRIAKDIFGDDWQM